MLEAHWQSEGYTAPNNLTYPWLWLWDSCFHAIVWAELGETERAITELRSVFAEQTPRGFVPHMRYRKDPHHHGAFWGRPGVSTITQPPMYGHAIAVLERLGVHVPDDLRAAAHTGIEWILTHRRRGERGIVICHPWESGCDDSPAWDAYGAGDRARWYERKGELVASLVLDDEGAAVANPRFEVESPIFCALVAFNAAELGIAVDVAVGTQSTTVDGLLACLVDDRRDLLEMALDDAHFGGAYGPAGVHRAYPTFDATRYWRGPAWPQLCYLFLVAARRFGHDDLALELAARLVRGARRSGFAEYWHPDSGEGYGARPQSWTTLAVVAEAFIRARR